MKLTTKQAKPIIALTFPDYRGRKFTLQFTERVMFYDTNWSGGTCNKYAAVKTDGDVRKFYAPAPWVNAVEGRTVDLPEDVLLVERSWFCGKDCWITIYAHPCHAPKWLGAGVAENGGLKVGDPVWFRPEGPGFTGRQVGGWVQEFWNGKVIVKYSGHVWIVRADEVEPRDLETEVVEL